MYEILDQYKIKFSTPLDMCGMSLITSTNESLSTFVGAHYTLSRASSLLSQILQKLVNNDVTEGAFAIQGIEIAIINASQTKIYASWEEYEANAVPDFILPTEHLKIIAEAWRDHLQKSSK